MTNNCICRPALGNTVDGKPCPKHTPPQQATNNAELKSGQVCPIHHSTDCCGRWANPHADCQKREAELLRAIREMEKALDSAKEWADKIADDERVCGWVHQEDYSLYLFLADCPVDFDKALSLAREVLKP